jgi:hypothetical protein
MWVVGGGGYTLVIKEAGRIGDGECYGVGAWVASSNDAHPRIRIGADGPYSSSGGYYHAKDFVWSHVF